MNYPAVILLILLFVSNAMALDFLYNDKAKFSGIFNILSLCLAVALAYTFNQIKSIMIFLGVAVVIVIAIVLMRWLLRRKLEKKTKIKGETDENN